MALIPAHQTLNLVVGLNLRNRSSLDALLKAQDDPKSALFHHYLTPQQFADRFGPQATTITAVERYLSSQGLQITSVSPNHTLIFTAGVASAVEKAFAVSIADFAYEGRTVYAPLTEPSVPASLSGMIQGITGLDNVARGYHLPLQHADRQHAPKTHFHPAAASCPTGGYYPADFWSGYDIGPLVYNGYTGVGQNVAIVEFDGYNPSDVNGFDACTGFNPLSYTQQYVASNAPTTPLTAPDGEEADADMEIAQGMAYSAHQYIYLGNYEQIVCDQNNYCKATIYPGDVEDVYSHIVADNLANIVSVSWTAGCDNLDVTAAEESMLDTLTTQGTSQGISFFVASGDNGADECSGGAQGVSALAADPHVIGVGGTSLNIGVSETAWNNSSGSSGGGISGFFPMPIYQTQFGIGSASSKRAVPDVSADADPNYGYNIYCSVSTVNHGYCIGWMLFGGTSAATPLWAGIAADINQYLTAVGKPTLGAANALLYQVDYSPNPYVPFHDITSGCDQNQVYCAGPGYDLVTGLGSPDAWNIARDIVAQIQTNVESDVVWGMNTGSSTDLYAAFYQSSNPSWEQVDVSNTIRSLNSSDSTLSLVANTGQPGIVSYQTSGDGSQRDVFALATVSGSRYIYGFTYLPATGAWSDLGEISASDSAHLPVRNPVVVANGTPTLRAVSIYGITSSGHLIEYYLSNSARQSGGTLKNPWSFTDISSVTGQICDDAISPTAVVRNNGVIVFADCGNKLVDFYPNNSGTWVANTGIPGNSIPNASEAFPGHSLASLVVPGNPSALEAYVASDRNGVSALSEYLYNGSTWSSYTLPSSGYTPDQVMGITVAVNFSGVPISEVIVTAPAPTSCGTQPASVQYLYQPNLPNPAWHTTVLSQPGGTSADAIVEYYGSTITEALTGQYYRTATIGAAGGGGCSSSLPINEDDSTLSSSTTQSWSYNLVSSASVSYDNAGIDPAVTLLSY